MRFKVSGNEEQFNAWYGEMEHLVAQFPGIISKEFYSAIDENGRVTAILGFDNMAYANKWMESEQRTDMWEKASAKILAEIEEWIRIRNIVWPTARSSKKKKWMQVLVTFIGIFPLSLIIPPLVESAIVSLFSAHWLLKSSISVLVLVVLMVFFVMPFLIRITQKWLE